MESCQQDAGIEKMYQLNLRTSWFCNLNRRQICPVNGNYYSITSDDGKATYFFDAKKDFLTTGILLRNLSEKQILKMSRIEAISLYWILKTR